MSRGKAIQCLTLGISALGKQFVAVIPRTKGHDVVNWFTLSSLFPHALETSFLFCFVNGIFLLLSPRRSPNAQFSAEKAAREKKLERWTPRTHRKGGRKKNVGLPPSSRVCRSPHRQPVSFSPFFHPAARGWPALLFCLFLRCARFLATEMTPRNEPTEGRATNKEDNGKHQKKRRQDRKVNCTATARRHRELKQSD